MRPPNEIFQFNVYGMKAIKLWDLFNIQPLAYQPLIGEGHPMLQRTAGIRTIYFGVQNFRTGSFYVSTSSINLGRAT